MYDVALTSVVSATTGSPDACFTVECHEGGTVPDDRPFHPIAHCFHRFSLRPACGGPGRRTQCPALSAQPPVCRGDACNRPRSGGDPLRASCRPRWVSSAVV